MEDGGLAVLKDISNKLDIKSGVVNCHHPNRPQLGKKTLRLMVVLETVHRVLDT